MASCAWVLVWWAADNLQESSKFIYTVGASGSQLLRLPFTSIYLILLIDIYGWMCIKHLLSVHPLTERSVVSSSGEWEQRCTGIWLSPCFHFCRVHSQWLAGSHGSKEFLKFRLLQKSCKHIRVEPTKEEEQPMGDEPLVTGDSPPEWNTLSTLCPANSPGSLLPCLVCLFVLFLREDGIWTQLKLLTEFLNLF